MTSKSINLRPMILQQNIYKIIQKVWYKNKSRYDGGMSGQGHSDSPKRMSKLLSNPPFLPSLTCPPPISLHSPPCLSPRDFIQINGRDPIGQSSFPIWHRFPNFIVTIAPFGSLFRSHSFQK